MSICNGYAASQMRKEAGYISALTIKVWLQG